MKQVQSVWKEMREIHDTRTGVLYFHLLNRFFTPQVKEMWEQKFDWESNTELLRLLSLETTNNEFWGEIWINIKEKYMLSIHVMYLYSVVYEYVYKIWLYEWILV